MNVIKFLFLIYYKQNLIRQKILILKGVILCRKSKKTNKKCKIKQKVFNFNFKEALRL